jgi:hypothetical protein
VNAAITSPRDARCTLGLAIGDRPHCPEIYSSPTRQLENASEVPLAVTDDHLLAVRGDEKLGGRPCAQYFVGSRTVLVDRVTQIAETICEHDHAVFTGRCYDCSGAVAIKDSIPSTSE